MTHRMLLYVRCLIGNLPRQIRRSHQELIDRALGGASLKALVADFDRAWPGIPRSREILVLAEEYGAM